MEQIIVRETTRNHHRTTSGRTTATTHRQFECLFWKLVHSTRQCHFKKSQICDSSDHTPRPQPVIDHVWCFLAHYVRETLCVAVRNYLLKGTLLQMFITCSSLRNVRSETSWNRPCFIDCSNSYWILNWFYWQGMAVFLVLLHQDLFPVTVFTVCSLFTRITSFLEDTLDSTLPYAKKWGNFTHCAAVGTPKHHSIFWSLWHISVSTTFNALFPTSERLSHSTLLLWSQSRSLGSIRDTFSTPCV